MKKLILLITILLCAVTVASCQEEDVLGPLSEQKIAAGHDFSLVIDQEGHLFGFGNQAFGTLGNGITMFTSQLTPLNLDSFFYLNDNETFGSVYAGKHHAFAVTSDMRVFAWGLNSSGQLGFNHIQEMVSTPVDITDSLALLEGESISKWVQGEFHTVILTTQYRVIVWGYNSDTELGTHDFDASSFMGFYASNPIDITSYFDLSDDENVIDIGKHVVLTSHHRIIGWGPFVNSVDGSKTFRDITADFTWVNDEYVTEVHHSGEMLVTNENRYYTSVRIFESGKMQIKYVEVQFDETPNSSIKYLNLCLGNMIVMNQEDEVFGYGLNNMGQLGVGDNVSQGEVSVSSAPMVVTYDLSLLPWSIDWLENETMKDIKISIRHTIMMTSMGRIFVWGSNMYGQIGQGELTQSYDPILLTLI